MNGRPPLSRFTSAVLWAGTILFWVVLYGLTSWGGLEQTDAVLSAVLFVVLPALAVLDPTLTLTQPREVTACTGMDALVHAVETAVTNKRNERSELAQRDRLAIRRTEQVPVAYQVTAKGLFTAPRWV